MTRSTAPVELDGCTADCTVDCGRCKGKPFERAVREVERLRERDQAWAKVVRYLYETDGQSPQFGASGLWCDLFDEATADG